MSQEDTKRIGGFISIVVDISWVLNYGYPAFQPPREMAQTYFIMTLSGMVLLIAWNYAFKDLWIEDLDTYRISLLFAFLTSMVSILSWSSNRASSGLFCNSSFFLLLLTPMAEWLKIVPPPSSSRMRSILVSILELLLSVIFGMLINFLIKGTF